MVRKTAIVLAAAAASLQGAHAFVTAGAAPNLRARGGVSALSMDMQSDKCEQRLRAEISRRAAGLLLSGAAWQLTTVPASAFKWATVERVAKDPALLKDVFDQDKTDAAVKRWKKSMNMVKGVDAVDAASYTAEFEEFKLAVGKVKKLKIGDEIIENPSDEQLLRAWKDEEVKRALAREEKGEEPLTRPVKDDQGAVVYLPPVVTKQSSPEALALGKHLKDIGATMYGAFWCSHCYGQKQVFGREATDQFVQYVECDKKGANSKRDFCKEQKVPGFPTWDINGKLYPGEKTLEDLAKLSNFDLKTGKAKS